MTSEPDNEAEGELDRPLEVAKAEYDTVQFSRTEDGRVVGAPTDDDGGVLGRSEGDD